jgi:hypothetical protein
MTLTYKDEINWGLAMFPGDGNCGPPNNIIAPAPGQEDLVSSTVANTLPAGFTPIDGAIQAVQTGGYLDDPATRDYMLFISDGAETCNGAQATTTQRIADMYAAGIGTFVVGFGGGVDPNSLNQFANAGGYPNTAGGTSYYQADSARSSRRWRRSSGRWSVATSRCSRRRPIPQ